MDRRRARARTLTGAALTGAALTGAALFVLLAAAADAPVVPIAEARWLAPGAVFEGLTRQPPECLAWPKQEPERRSVAIGRAAFRAPLLLGGQAARAGLSCASCHRNGRDNPYFLFPRLSGAPGTADVTSSFMSKHRGDGAFNPRPIPDLVAPPRLAPHDRQSRALERFTRGLIVEEFDGPEPSLAVLTGLADYVRAMAPGACPSAKSVAVTLDVMLFDAGAALAAASAAASAGGGEGDRETSRLLISAARSTLERIDERFRLPGLEKSQAILRDADAELGTIRRMETAASAAAIQSWRERWPARARQLRRQERRSLFSPATLRRELAR